MLTVGHAASEFLDQMLSDDAVSDDAVMRVISRDGGFGLEIDTVQPGDETFAHSEKTVLAIDEQVSELLANNKLDVDATGDQPELRLMEQQGLN